MSKLDTVVDSVPSTWVVAAIVAGLGLLTPTPTHAQQQRADGFRAEHFDPVASQHSGVLNLRGADVQPHLSLSAGLFNHYTDAPMRESNRSTDSDLMFLQRHVTSELGLTVGLFDLAQVSVAAPVVSAQWGENMPGYPFESDSRADLGGFPYGDTRAALDLVLVKPEWTGGLGLAANTTFRLPTGTTDDLTSDGRLRVTPGLSLAKHWEAGHKLIANGGMTIGSPIRVPEYRYTDAGMVSAGLGGVVAINSTVNLIGSVFGQGSVVDDLGSDADGEPLQNTARSLEFLAGFRFNFGDFQIQSGAGAGLNSGIPAPDFRAFASVNWLIDTASGQSDQSGTSKPRVQDEKSADDEKKTAAREREEAADEKPSDPEGTEKPSDADEETKVATKESPDSETDDQATRPEPQPEETEEPKEQETTAEDEQTDTSEQARETDDEPAASDQEQKDTAEQKDEQKEQEKAKVVKQKIDVSERIRFGRGSSTLDRTSHSSLRKVADLLEKHPQITKLVVEGHTSSRGDEALNKRLSEKRAQAVKDFLVRQGVASQRVETRGYGESQPLEPGNHAKNRRVEFVIKEVDGEPVEEGEAVIEQQK